MRSPLWGLLLVRLHFQSHRSFLHFGALFLERGDEGKKTVRTQNTGTTNLIPWRRGNYYIILHEKHFFTQGQYWKRREKKIHGIIIWSVQTIKLQKQAAIWEPFIQTLSVCCPNYHLLYKLHSYWEHLCAIFVLLSVQIYMSFLITYLQVWRSL